MAQVQVRLILVNESQVVLTANQNDGCIGAKPFDLTNPHLFAILQRARLTKVKAHEHDVRSAIGKSPIFVMVSKSVPKAQRDIHAIYRRPRIFQDL